VLDTLLWVSLVAASYCVLFSSRAQAVAQPTGRGGPPPKP